MTLCDPSKTEGRRHRVIAETERVGVEIFGTMPQYTWSTSLTAVPIRGGVAVQVIGRDAVRMTREEARAFARSLLALTND